MSKYKAPTMFETTTSVEGFEENLSANMKFLKENYLELPEQAQIDFAKSLCSWYDRYDSLSSKQMYRAMQFFNQVKEITGKEPEYSRGNVVSLHKTQETTRQDQPTRVPVDTVKALAVISMFDKVVEKIKYPSIVIPLDKEMKERDGAIIEAISFYRMVKKPGCVGITNNRKGAAFRALGIIDRAGKVEWTQANTTAEVGNEIKGIIESIIEKAAIAGKRICHCCFCGLPLQNKVSVYHGYGPICAGNWGLPWEGEPKEEIKLEDI